MKLNFKSIAAAVGLASVAVLCGCATPEPLGVIYTGITQPLAVGNGDMKFTQKGEANAICMFGLFACGDYSLNAACKNGNITKISWANVEVRNYFGIYGSYTTKVYGFAE